MGAAAVAAIRPALDELAAAARSMDASDEPEWCLTLSLPGSEETAWIQVMPGTLNAAYPFAHPPDRKVAIALGDLASSAPLIDWQPELFATFDVDDVELADLARIIDRYFVAILGADDVGYRPRIELAPLF
jgi:hypothetical protein